MSETQERRAAGVNRVAVSRPVDICGRDATVPAFEAESVEVSGRGIRVRTPYLPPLGAPLVCRLEDGGREIVVEGVVAWQNERDDGGEFGVQFTALDSRSVEALKSLCGMSEDPAPTQASAKTDDPAAPAGMPVKLHIEGLGAPMKARVRTGTSRKLQVGSNLEFLKVGRGLEVEDVEAGERRGARIDAVSIALDPKTQVPQLVVALRYEGEDTTPEPSVIASSTEDVVSPAAGATAARAEAESAPASVDGGDDLDDEEPNDEGADDEVDASAMRTGVDAFAVSVGTKAKATGRVLAKVGGAAASGFGKWLKIGGSRLGELAARRSAANAKRRSTSPAPAQASPPTQRRLRPQNGTRPASSEGTNRRRVIVGASAAGVLTLAIGTLALANRGGKNDPAQAPAAPAADLAPLAAATPASLATPATGALPAQPTPVQPGALAAAARPDALVATAPGAPAPAQTAPAAPGQRPGVIADVPLFGPTPMATLEPAPLGPAPDQLAAAPAVPVAKPLSAKPDEFAEPEAEDESFGESASKKDKEEKPAKPDVRPDDVKPFLGGKLHQPIVYRLKLDEPGSALEGTKTASGFSVVVPSRKVTESGTAITKRDDRIADVKIKNGAGGTKITFVFRGNKVPGYKVRLKKSYVEFFVSSPDGAK
jgi:hypothetical protein